MSFYNMVHGVNPLAGMVLAMIGAKKEDISRFRDAYYDGEHLCIHTRTGGGNREHYDNSHLCDLPGYAYDEDDDYDCTYATYYFAVPEQFAWFKAWAADKTERPAGERWAEAIERIKSAPADDPLVQRMTEAMKPVTDFLAERAK